MTGNLMHKFSSRTVFDISSFAAGASLSLLFFVSPVFAQDVNGASLNGSTTLGAGFLPDPYVTAIEPGGTTAVTDLGAGCSGYIYATAPDFELVLDSQTALIGIFVSASIDTTLVINDPNGKWICNDDNAEAGGNNPGVSLVNPAQGTYDIWVGTYEEAVTGATGNLIITEYAASQWAGLEINGATNGAAVDTYTDTSDSNTDEETASAEEVECLDDFNQYMVDLGEFQSTVYQADINFVCGDGDVCRAGTHSPSYYYALGEACDLLLGPFENAKQACLNFPDMDSLFYPEMCR
jgi:hypothetical protein